MKFHSNIGSVIIKNIKEKDKKGSITLSFKIALKLSALFLLDNLLDNSEKTNVISKETKRIIPVYFERKENDF